MSSRRGQQIIFTLRPKYRRKTHIPLKRIEMPIKLERGSLDRSELLSQQERLQIRRALKARNKRIFWTSAVLTLVIMAVLVIFTSHYLNDIAQKI